MGWAALDLLAVELRTPVYKQTYSVAIKRALVKESLIFYDQMGTPAAVNRIIEAVFGVGYIKEWWECGLQPHHFKAYTTNPVVTAANVQEFKEVLNSVKRLSSWLDEVVLDLSTDAAQPKVGFFVHTGDIVTLNKATM